MDQKKTIFAGLIIMVLFCCSNALAMTAGLTWSYQEFGVGASSGYWNGTARLVDGNVTDENSKNGSDSTFTGTLNQGDAIVADASITNTPGTMSVGAIAEMTGTANGFTMYTGVRAHNELPHGVYNSSNARGDASTSFNGEFIPDYNTLVIDFSASYNLFAEGLGADSIQNSMIDILIEIGQGDGEEYWEIESLFEEVALSGVDGDDLLDDHIELYEIDVNPGESYWINISIREDAQIYNMGDAGHMSVNATIGLSSTQVPLPAGFWLMISGCLSLTAVLKRKKTV